MIPRTRSCVAAKEKKNFFTLLPNSQLYCYSFLFSNFTDILFIFPTISTFHGDALETKAACGISVQ